MSDRNRARKRRAVAPAAVLRAKPAAAVTVRLEEVRSHPATHREATPAAMPGFERAALIAAGGAALAAFVVYSLTVEPSLPTGDSGELITAATVLGVAHPPGYPLYTMLGHLVTLLPGGSPALRMNLLSALLDSIAVGVVFLTIHRLVSVRADGALASSRRWTPYIAATCGSLLLAFSSLFWAYSIVAEVFALNNLFAAVLLFVGIEWCRQPQRTRLLWLFMLVLGLALCNQQTIVLLLPAFAVLGSQGWNLLPRAAGPLRISLRDLGIALGALVVGLLPYAYLPIAASSKPVLNWGDPSTFSRFLTQVERGNYGTASLVAGGKTGSVWENLKLLGTSLTHGFVYAGILLAAAGLWWAWRHRRAEGTALFVAFLVAGPVFQIYTNTAYPDAVYKGIVARFYILPSVALAMLAGLGAWWALGQAGRVRASRRGLALVAASAALLVVPVAAATDHYSSENQSSNHVALSYAEDLLGPLAPNAILLMRGDENYTSTVYAQFVDHYRPDVVALDTELLKDGAFVTQIERQNPDVLIPFTAYDGGATTSLNALVSANLTLHPVYVVGEQQEKKFGAPFTRLKYGLVDQLVKKRIVSDTWALLRTNPKELERLRYPTRVYPKDTWDSVIADNYGDAAAEVGFALDDGNPANLADAERMYRTSIRLAPDGASAYRNLGLILYKHGGDRLEIAALWKTYLRLEPTGPQASDIRRALAELGRSGS